MKKTITDAHGYTIESLKQAIRQYKDINKAETKITVILLCMQGYGVIQIEKMYAICRKAASSYIDTFNEFGMEKLLEYKTSPGRKPLLSDEEKTLLRDALSSTPKEMMCGNSENWTTTEVRKFINNEFNKDMTQVGILKMLRKMGYTFTRPTYVLARASKKNC